MSRRRLPRPFQDFVDAFLKEQGEPERASVAELGDNFIVWLQRRPEQDGPLAKAAMDAMRREGSQKWMRETLGHRVVFVDQSTRQVLAGRTRAGVPVRDEHGAPLGTYQQVFFRSMTRREFADELVKWRANWAGAGAYVALGQQIERAWTDHPTIATVGEVCDAAGIVLPPELRSAS